MNWWPGQVSDERMLRGESGRSEEVAENLRKA